jgi:hypothetical protein
MCREGTRALEEASNIVLPTIVGWCFGTGKIGTKRESIGTAVVLGEKFIWDYKVAARESMVSERVVPRANKGWSVTGANRRVLGKKFRIGSSFKDGTILQNHACADDERVDIKFRADAKGVNKRCQLFDAKDDIWVLKSVITVEDVGRQSVVVEDVSRRCDKKWGRDGRAGRSSRASRNSGAGARGEWIRVDFVKVETVE